MEIHLTPEKEALLQQIAARSGKATAEVVQEAVDRLLDYDAWSIAKIEQGLAEANRGELIEHDEVVARIERRIQAKSSRS
jgi:predicted transcriptional regulator